MCGVFGVLKHGAGALDERRLDLTVRLLRHRGPDHNARFVGERIGLAYTRLALLDLNPRSNQPFWDRSHRYCLVYNGEIYNYRELRAELAAEGVSFRTTSDTEVLLESLIHHGVDISLRRLEGMFAFVLYDVQNGSLTLARDRFGIKPLYVYDEDDMFVCASEVGAMRPWIPLAPDLLSVSSYLQGFGGSTQGNSFYSKVRIVPPGTVVSVTPGSRARYRTFWRLPDFVDPDEAARLRALSARRIVDEMEERLLESVRMQLLADAPVGVLCSGGVDSSLITAMASRFHSNLAIFHANVVGPESEFEAAAALARHLKLDLKAAKVVDQDSIDAMPDVMLHYGQPFSYHPNSIPFLLVSRLVRESGVKGILSGEGADESYLGYSWVIFNLRTFLSQAPARMQRTAHQALKKGLGHILGRPPMIRGNDVGTLLRGLHNRFEAEIEAEEIREEITRRYGREATDREVVTVSQLGYHLRTLLHRNDCLGMAASIEARFPFLDSGLVRLAVNMPYNVKVRFSPATLDRAHYFLRDKWVLREVAQRYLPAALARRTKRGFPIGAHSRMCIAPELFDDSFVADLFELDGRGIRFLLDRANQNLRLRLLHLEVWGGVCLQGMGPGDVKARLQKHITIR
jgi:asparagine synthase (glutamine-hydrolysing)